MTTFATLPFILALAVAQAQVQNPPSPPPAAAAPPAAPAQIAPPLAPPPTTILTIGDALRLADERNLDLKAAAARLRQAQQATSKAWAGYLPSLTASGAYTHNEFAAIFPPIILPQGSFGAGLPQRDLPIIPEAITIIPREQLAGQVEADQVLFSPALWYGIQAASRGTDAAKLSVENARRDILFGAAQAYYGVAALRRTAQVAERLLEIAQRQEKDARVRFQAGTIAKVGLLRAEIDRARAEQDLRRARNAYESARIGLAALLDRPVDFDIVDPPEPPLTGSGAQLEASALRDRPDVLAARRTLDSQRSAYRAQIGTYFPNLSAFGRWQAQNAAGFTGQQTQWALGVALQWRILDGGLREAQLREARARVDEAEANVASIEVKARAEVGQSLLDLESARANAEKAKEQRDLAAENQRLVDVSYRAGAATAVEQADAVAALRNAEIAQQSETLGAQLAALRVLRSAGTSLR